MLKEDKILETQQQNPNEARDKVYSKTLDWKKQEHTVTVTLAEMKGYRRGDLDDCYFGGRQGQRGCLNAGMRWL